MNDDEFRKHMLRIRGVSIPCAKCQGSGVRMYSNTSTWRRGIGGCAMTYDVCDACWGSGDADRIGLDLRANQQKQRDWENDQCLQYFARVTGCSLGVTSGHTEAIARLLEKEERRRKTPFDHEHRGFFWRCTLRAMASALRGLSRTCHEEGVAGE